jgi:hypothetical protein
MARGGLRGPRVYGQVKTTTTKSHVSSGAIVGSGASLSGTVRRNVIHDAIGALVGAGASLSGAARRAITHNSSGALVGAGSQLSGEAQLNMFMLFGGNLGQQNTAGQAFAFVNMASYIRPWVQSVGFSGGWSQSCGELTAAISSDEFESYVVESSVGLPAGVYTITNPTAAWLNMGDFVTTTGWTNATSFTFTLAPGFAWWIKVRGSLLRHATPFSILHSSHLAQFAAGNVWRPEFFSFVQNLGVKVIRWMDYQATNTNLEETYADRTPVDAISYQNMLAGITPPYEIQADLCNRLNATGWWNIPTRAATTYGPAMLTTLRSSLNVALRSGIRCEYANELWNYNNPFADMTRWVEFKDHTRRTATRVAGTDNFTLTAHGIANATEVMHFRTRANTLAGVWTGNMLNGTTSFVEVIDANTIKFHSGSVGGAVVAAEAGQVDTIFIVLNEAGKVANLNEHFGENTLAHWAAMDVVSTDYIHVMGAQAANSGTTSGRMAVTGALAATDEVAIAPYMFDLWCHCALDQANGQITPKAWSNEPATFYVGRYTAGSPTPTKQQIIDGTGTGFQSKTTIATDGGSSYINGTAIGSLTNDVNWDFHIVYDHTTYQWLLPVATAAAKAVAATVNAPDSYANMSLRHRLYGIPQSVGWVAATIAAAGGKDVVCYEGGSHFSTTGPGGNSGASQAWQSAYLESQEYSDTLQYYFYALAAAGVKLFTYFVTDALVANSSWKIADSYTDTTDKRYLRIAAQAGVVNTYTQIAPADTSDSITSAPGSFPYTVRALPGGLTYQIVDGDEVENFDISSTNLRMVSADGVNWANSVFITLKLLASDGHTEDVMSSVVALGPPAFYDPDDHFAWDSVADTNNAAINVQVGSNLTLAPGSGATISGGLWDNLTTNAYTASQGSVASFNNTTKDFVYIHAMNLGAQAGNFVGCGIGIGSGTFFTPQRQGGNCVAYYYNGTVDGGVTLGPLDATTRVYWFHYSAADGKYRCGYNQTYTNASGAAGDTPPITFPATFTRDVGVGETARQYGSIRLINKAGLSQAAVLAAVQKVQNVHGL